MNKLEGKVAVITGGNSGIGLATAKLYREQGAKVIITASSEESFNKSIKEFGSQFEVVKTDVRKIGDLQHLAKAVKEKYGTVDVLFANAGVAYFAPIDKVTEDFYNTQFDVNVKGTLFLIKEFLPMMKKGSSVIITTSATNTKGIGGASVYAATKAALRSMARSLAAELTPQGIRVNALSPGPVETPIYSKLGMTEEQMKAWEGQIQASTPMGRFGQPEEMASAALFLATPDSSFMVGSELVADGGFSQL